MQSGKGKKKGNKTKPKQTPQPKTPPRKEVFASSETNDGVHTEQVKQRLHSHPVSVGYCPLHRVHAYDAVSLRPVLNDPTHFEVSQHRS